MNRLLSAELMTLPADKIDAEYFMEPRRRGLRHGVAPPQAQRAAQRPARAAAEGRSSPGPLSGRAVTAPFTALRLPCSDSADAGQARGDPKHLGGIYKKLCV